MKVFIDTSAWIALLVHTDHLHTRATKQYQQYVKKSAVFFTNEFVLSELYTRMVYDKGKASLQHTIKTVQNLSDGGNIAVYTSNPTIMMNAQNCMVRFAEHKLSFTDASIVACVKLYKLDEVFTFDSDFAKVGLFVKPTKVL
jgi:predicted nucleic acid-binding protein